MHKEIREAILELIEKKTKIHKSTEARLDRKKNKTELYRQLAILYEKDIEKSDISNKDLLKKHGILDKEGLIEYVRFKYIAGKIDTVGINNSKDSKELFHELLKFLDKGGYTDNEIKEYIKLEIEIYEERIAYSNKDKRGSKEKEKNHNISSYLLNVDTLYSDGGLGSKLCSDLRTLNISNQARSDVINKMISSINKDGEFVDYIEKMINKTDLGKYISDEEAKELLKKYLIKQKYKTPLHNIEQFVYLFKINNLEKTRILKEL